VFEGKASNRFESGAYLRYVSISNQIATLPSHFKHMKMAFKAQIVFEGKASRGLKAERTR
jgi:hypothetical protein